MHELNCNTCDKKVAFDFGLNVMVLRRQMDSQGRSIDDKGKVKSDLLIY